MADWSDIDLNINPEDIDDRVIDAPRITFTRDKEFAHAYVSAFPPEVFESEQDIIEQILIERIVQENRGTKPESIFQALKENLEQAGGQLVITEHENGGIVIHHPGDHLTWLGLDEDDFMDVQDISRGKLMGELEDELESMSTEELVESLKENGERELLEIIAGHFRRKSDDGR